MGIACDEVCWQTLLTSGFFGVYFFGVHSRSVKVNYDRYSLLRRNKDANVTFCFFVFDFNLYIGYRYRQRNKHLKEVKKLLTRDKKVIKTT